MNTTNILLATTSLLIVVAFGLTFGGFSKKRNDPKNQEELALLKRQVEALEADRLASERNRIRAALPTPAAPTVAPEPLPVAPTATSTTELDNETIKELEDKIKELEDTTKGLTAENERLNEERDKERIKQQMQAKRIDTAFKMGTVLTANKEHGLVTFKPNPQAPNHQPGLILAVRRNSGILGKIQIKRLAENGDYVADMRPQPYAEDGYPNILPGDHIILEPDFLDE